MLYIPQEEQLTAWYTKRERERERDERKQKIKHSITYNAMSMFGCFYSHIPDLTLSLAFQININTHTHTHTLTHTNTHRLHILVWNLWCSYRYARKKRFEFIIRAADNRFFYPLKPFIFQVKLFKFQRNEKKKFLFLFWIKRGSLRISEI